MEYGGTWYFAFEIYWPLPIYLCTDKYFYKNGILWRDSPKLSEKYWFVQKYYRHKQVEVRECCKTKADTVKDLENSDENGKASTCSNFLESRNQTTENKIKGS